MYVACIVYRYLVKVQKQLSSMTVLSSNDITWLYSESMPSQHWWPVDNKISSTCLFFLLGWSLDVHTGSQ